MSGLVLPSTISNVKGLSPVYKKITDKNGDSYIVNTNNIATVCEKKTAADNYGSESKVGVFVNGFQKPIELTSKTPEEFAVDIFSRQTKTEKE